VTRFGVQGRRALIALAVPLLLSGCITLRDGHGGHGRHGFSDDRSQVQLVSALVGGKNVFIPSTIVLTAGSGRTLSVFNTTDQPHGFAIPGLGVEVVLQPGAEQVIPLPTLEAHHLYAINCHLHPPHRSATLMVVPAR
jgi:Cupredoxin-like domain